MKKKILTLFILLAVTFILSSCDFFKGLTTTGLATEDTTIVSTTTKVTTDDTITNIETTQTPTTSEPTTTTSPQTTTEATTTTQQTTTTEQTTTTAPTTTQPTTTTEQTTTTTTQLSQEPFYPSGYSLLQDEKSYIGIPATGDVKVLVFAVDFSDYPSDQYGISLDDLNIAFNGDSSQLDFESLQSFYQKSSFDQLNITADVHGYYRANEPSTYYQDLYDKYWATDPNTGEWLYDDTESSLSDSDIIQEVLNYYDAEIDYSQYDANGDGYIDGIYIIYTHPVSWNDGSDLWWAYQYYYAYNNDTFDGMYADYYVWSGSEFFTYSSDAIDARTIIHETGHMLGLEDYYDYDTSDANNNSGGLGGADMMDATHGDHGPFSKILLGWITPLVVENPAQVDLSAYENTGEVILLTDHWNNTIFDEYLLISFYTPSGLYEADTDYYFSIQGVLIYHVNAAIDNGYDSSLGYYSMYNNNNTDTPDKLISIVEADSNDFIERFDRLQNTDLFLPGYNLGGNVYPNFQWDSGEYFPYIVSIESIISGEVIIDITYG